MATLLSLYFASGFLLVVIALPLIFGKIKPNPFYGFRVAKTLNNPELWYAVNKYSGRLLFYCGLGTMLASIGVYLIPGLTLDAYALICLAIFTLFLSISIFLSVRYMNRVNQ
jgi:uncharacterized membrane protein